MSKGPDWRKVRRAVERANGGWYLLGEDLPYTTAETVRQGAVNAMLGVKVLTRNNHTVNGKRRCDIYLRLEVPSAAQDHSRSTAH